MGVNPNPPSGYASDYYSVQISRTGFNIGLEDMQPTILSGLCD